VTLLPISNVGRELKFRIEANLDVEPAPEPVSFDTVLQMGSGEFRVQNP
jgi:predicted component of type VI protein secretion system